MGELMEQIQKLAGRPIETGCKLIETLLGKPFTIAGEIAADQLQAWQWANRIRIAERAEALLEEKNIAKRVLPPSIPQRNEHLRLLADLRSC